MKFIKMHSLGNDFVITTEVPQDIKQICDRKLKVMPRIIANHMEDQKCEFKKKNGHIN